MSARVQVTVCAYDSSLTGGEMLEQSTMNIILCVILSSSSSSSNNSSLLSVLCCKSLCKSSLLLSSSVSSCALGVFTLSVKSYSSTSLLFVKMMLLLLLLSWVRFGCRFLVDGIPLNPKHTREQSRQVRFVIVVSLCA